MSTGPKERHDMSGLTRISNGCQQNRWNCKSRRNVNVTLRVIATRALKLGMVRRVIPMRVIAAGKVYMEERM
jgi:hypothetical protein